MNYLYMTVDLSAECPYKRIGGMSVPYPLLGIGDLFLYYPVVGYVVCPAPIIHPQFGSILYRIYYGILHMS